MLFTSGGLIKIMNVIFLNVQLEFKIFASIFFKTAQKLTYNAETPLFSFNLYYTTQTRYVNNFFIFSYALRKY